MCVHVEGWEYGCVSTGIMMMRYCIDCEENEISKVFADDCLAYLSVLQHTASGGEGGHIDIYPHLDIIALLCQIATAKLAKNDV
mmetsp:Transcript_9521/g.21478  ORF Transcript_9521/g.21478 Transcript_9521/m.21478 type:complete len:84 (+) Transcript_9521:799-1050(+)